MCKLTHKHKVQLSTLCTCSVGNSAIMDSYIDKRTERDWKRPIAPNKVGVLTFSYARALFSPF